MTRGRSFRVNKNDLNEVKRAKQIEQSRKRTYIKKSSYWKEECEHERDSSKMTAKCPDGRELAVCRKCRRGYDVTAREKQKVTKREEDDYEEDPFHAVKVAADRAEAKRKMFWKKKRYYSPKRYDD